MTFISLVTRRRPMSTRGSLYLGIVGVMASTVLSAPPASAEDVPRMREVAEASGILLGTGAVNPNYLDDPEFARILREQFSSLSPENELKWTLSEPEPGVFEFEGLDRLVAFARKHGMVVKGHGLATGSNFMPDYVLAATKPKQLKKVIRRHFRVIMTRYRDDMDRWDVMTEALSTFGGTGLVQNHFFSVLGPDYVSLMFRMADRIDPDAKLFYNDNLVEYYPVKRQEMYDFIADMVERDVPIDGVGLQTHAVMQSPQPGVLTAIVDEYRALGLDVAVTELDVHTYDNTTQAVYQGQIMAELLAAGVTDISTWGFIDKYGYALFPQPGTPPPVGTRANIFDDNYQPKPSFFAMYRALVNQPCWIDAQPDCYAEALVANITGSLPVGAPAGLAAP